MTNASSAEIQTVENPKLGPNVIEVQGKIPVDEVNSQVKNALEQSFGVRGGSDGFNSQSVGPTFGAQVARSAVIAIIFSLIVISAYVAIRFEAKYAIPVIIALLHDILITGGIYSLTGREVTSGTVAAFLTILGYSMYDTVIVFDRIRENVPRMPRAAFSQIANKSMSEVLTRSLITGLSTVFLITVLFIFGGATLKDFAFAMGVGVLSGTYSSIFIATPVLTHWKEREPAYRARRGRLIEEMGYVPTFPEDNVVAKVGPDGEPAPAAPAPSRGETVPSRAGAPEPAGPVPVEPVEAGSQSSGAGGRWRGDGGRGTGAPSRWSPARRPSRPVRPLPSASASGASSGGVASTGGIDDGGQGLMAAVVWFTVGLAIWHFTVFVPDRFWGGIVGALLGAVAGAMVTGAIAQIASGSSIGQTDIATALVAIPGTLIGLAAIYALGISRERGGRKAAGLRSPGIGGATRWGRVPSPPVLSLAEVPTSASDTEALGRAFRLEPYSYAEVRALMEALALAEPVAVTLVRRGYRTVDEARAFLEATEVHDPFEFDSMEEVTERIRSAIAQGRTITVHGDYDCDGVCSTAILVRALRELGASCDWYIPDRLGDGYGLTVGGVERLAARGTGLLLTADCGITCADEVAAARAAGMEVIVTDHHEPGERLPDCPLLHPRLSSYPFGELCATGVAHKLSAALLGAERAADDLDLVALATVADLVPLRGENRALVRAGLRAARQARRPGLRALCAAAGVRPERLDEGDLAFRLARGSTPRAVCTAPTPASS